MYDLQVASGRGSRSGETFAGLSALGRGCKSALPQLASLATASAGAVVSGPRRNGAFRVTRVGRLAFPCASGHVCLIAARMAG